MALGIDVYRYQTVTDWNAVRHAGVGFVYVKGTDGGDPALVRADAQVAGARSVGLPVGLYHYAQLSPTPEYQADVLANEVERLHADGLAPALDLESPFVGDARARDFARRFLTRLHLRGFDRVTLYGNVTMLRGIDAPTLGVSGVRTWLAAYGVNDGERYGYSYAGHVDGHQYTSVGRVPGITGSVDLTWVDDPAAFYLEETTMALEPTDPNFVALIWRLKSALIDATETTDPRAGAGVEEVKLVKKINQLQADVTTIKTQLSELSDDEVKIIQAVRAQPTGGQVDVPALANALVTALVPLLPPNASPDEIADAVRDELGRHLVGSTNVDG